MDSPDRQHRLLGAFLAGELDAAGARRWDEHLLECEQCWQAVRENRVGRQAAQLLRQPAPPGLADRVAFAVEVPAAGRSAAPRRRPPRPPLPPRRPPPTPPPRGAPPRAPPPPRAVPPPR